MGVHGERETRLSSRHATLKSGEREQMRAWLEPCFDSVRRTVLRSKREFAFHAEATCIKQQKDSKAGAATFIGCYCAIFGGMPRISVYKRRTEITGWVRNLNEKQQQRGRAEKPTSLSVEGEFTAYLRGVI